MTVTLLLGGARSGKSTMALRLATDHAGPVTFIATATAEDDDMANRIANHKAERPSSWTTVEAPSELATAILQADSHCLLIVDCLTMWAANRFLAGASCDAQEIVDALFVRAGHSIVVTNEVGMGVVPGTPMGRDYRDELGRINRIVSLAADRAVLMVAGRLLELEHPEGSR